MKPRDVATGRPTRIRHHHVPAGIALVAALLFAACTSFSKLRENDDSVSEEEVLAAGNAKDPVLTAHLQHIVTHRADYSTGVVVAALVSLGKRRDPAAVDSIAALHDDEREEVRWHCVLALEQIGGDTAQQVLARMAASDPSEFVREEAATPN